MKILTIELTNLNSLRGNWRIDLTHKDYTSAGIFAVTGPTGAGKTTIFDAVCLALYGRTPRLKNVTAKENEIISKGAKICSAKVQFESGGKIYLCEWWQDISKKNAETTHTISLDGKPLTDSKKKRDTQALVTQITGMDFDRFVQAMLLEQGGFDRFLNAGKNERGEVLELITGTKIYSEISKRVFERAKAERLTLETQIAGLEAEKSRYGNMTEDSIQSEIDRKQEEISQAETAHKATDTLRTWLRDIERLKRDMAGVMESMRIHSRRAENFEATRKILDYAERAASLEGDYAVLCAKREAHIKARNESSTCAQKIMSQESELSQITEQLPGLADELSRLKGDFSGSHDFVLAGIESAIRLYDAQRGLVSEAEESYKQAKDELTKAQADSEKIISEGKLARTKFNEANENHSRIFAKIMDSRAKTSAAVFEEARAKLVDGEECPVCGSKTHPWAAHDVISCENPDDLFRQTERLEKELERAKSAVDSAQRVLDIATTNWHQVSAVMGAAEQRHKQCNEALIAARDKLNEFHAAVSEAIRPTKITGVTDTRVLLKRSREWAENITSLEKRIQDLESRKNVIEAGLSTLRENLQAKNSERDSISAELAELEESFRVKMREKNFDGEESFKAARKTSAEIDDMRRARDELASQTAMLQGQFSAVKKQLDDKQSMNLTDESPEKIDERFRNEESTLRRLQQEAGVLSQKLANVRDSADKSAKLEEDCRRQKQTADDWKLLSDMIGSREGDKFRVLAQKVTLALVVNHANEYLKRMNGRYTLTLNAKSTELELTVRDNEQSGVTRPTTNLSGGERFIISLALALGLSQISGSKAQVDSLFIDEGFGSLDEDALSSALDALGEIRREGRMIGIISHVAGISERISAKINVIRKSEGRSIITGPGCSGGYEA